MLHAMSNQMGPQQRHSPRCWAASAKSEAIFFPNFLHAIFSPCHTPTLAAHALLSFFLPWLCASSGHNQQQFWVPPG